MSAVRITSMARISMQACGGGKASYKCAETMAVSEVLAHAEPGTPAGRDLAHRAVSGAIHVSNTLGSQQEDRVRSAGS